MTLALVLLLVGLAIGWMMGLACGMFCRSIDLDLAPDPEDEWEALARPAPAQLALPPVPIRLALPAAPEPAAEGQESPPALIPRFGDTGATFYLPEVHGSDLRCMHGHVIVRGEVFWRVEVHLPDEDPMDLVVCSEHSTPLSVREEVPR